MEAGGGRRAWRLGEHLVARLCLRGPPLQIRRLPRAAVLPLRERGLLVLQAGPQLRQGLLRCLDARIRLLKLLRGAVPRPVRRPPLRLRLLLRGRKL